MKRLTPEVFAEFDRLGDRVRTGLQEVLRRHGIEAVATGRGSLFAVVPGNEPPRDFPRRLHRPLSARRRSRRSLWRC